MQSSKLKHIPNILTYCNLAIGILVIYLTVQKSTLPSIKLACNLLYIAVICDLLDGHLARHLNATSDIGKQLDSFADFITFGIAPIVVFLSKMNSVPWYILPILSFYPMTGAYRLARYNLQETSDYFIGLPITLSSFIMITVMLINSYLSGQYTEIFIIFYLSLLVLLSILMVSGFRLYRKPKIKGLLLRKRNIEI